MERCETKTEARKQADRQLRYGYFVNPPASTSGGWVVCPRCREHVSGFWFPWATGAEIRRALKDALVEHFTEWCEGAGA